MRVAPHGERVDDIAMSVASHDKRVYDIVMRGDPHDQRVYDIAMRVASHDERAYDIADIVNFLVWNGYFTFYDPLYSMSFYCNYNVNAPWNR